MRRKSHIVFKGTEISFCLTRLGILEVPFPCLRVTIRFPTLDTCPSFLKALQGI
jgi:hypothetical protein